MDALSFHPQSSAFRPPTHEHTFQYGEVMNDHSVSTSNVSPQATRPKTHLQTYFSPAAPPNFNPHFADSPYSSGSSSSFPNDSPPAEPPVEMESDYTPMISSPDDPRYSYHPFDQSDPSEWATRGLSAVSYNAEGFAHQPLSTLPMMPLSWPADTKKFQTQQFQHPQQQQQQQQQPQPQPTQRVNYPSFSGQAGRLRSMSDGTPPGSGNNANSMSSLYTQPLYSEQNTEELELIYPPDADSRLVNNGPNAHSHSSFSPMHSYPRDQQQGQHQRSQQPARIRRELGRSMSDAAMRPPMYTSASQPGAYGSFGLTMHPTNTTAFHSSDQDSQSHTGYAPPQQHQGGTQHNIPAPIRIPVPIYGSLPAYDFHEQASNLNTAYSSGGLPDQTTRVKEEFSPTTRFQQMEIRGGQGGCNSQYVNGDMNVGIRGGAGHNGGNQDVYKTVVVKEEDREKEFITRHPSDLANGGVHSELLHTEADEDAEGDDDRDGDYQTGEDDDFDFDDDGDSEYITRSRRASMSTTTHSLRPRRRSSSATRYQPYVFPNNGSTSPSATKSTDAPSSSDPTTSRPKTRVRSRQVVSLPVPIPVPNLTKKSRGRRVPTVDSLATNFGRSATGNPQNDGDDGDGKNARTYTCDAAGCGKCFARGEHLKRHVRSIHTYEKPHRCPFPGCDKDFSRHDNLRQHLRVHKGFQPHKDEYKPNTGEVW